MYPLHIYTDASKEGFAAAMGSDWVAGGWKTTLNLGSHMECKHETDPPTQDVYNQENINELELWAVVIGIKRWIQVLRDTTVILYTDNLQVLYAILNGRAKNNTCMTWVRELFWMGLINNMKISPRYVRSEDNVLADTLSRLSYRKTRNSAPDLLSAYNLCCKKELIDYCRSDVGVTR